MLTVSVTIEQQSIDELQREFAGFPKKLRKELAIAVNKTAAKTQTTIAKKIVKELTTTQRAVKQKTPIKKRAKTSEFNPHAVVLMRKAARIPLKEFKPQQTESGVTYQISKSSGRKTIPSAFIVDAYGGQVYRRPTKKRAVGRQKKGPSPWGVFVKNQLRVPTIVESKKELRKQIRERIRLIRLRKSGGIP